MSGEKDFRREAYVAIMLMGIVSMLGDIVYESGRGMAPNYLYFLGASAFLVGLTSGVGELVGYGARLISGPLADRSRAYWFFIFSGYGLILAIPLMGLTNSVWLVMAFVIAERLGKALRSPSRDAVVSVVSKGMGSGKAFGLHEFIDQIGAIVGPAFLGLMMMWTSNDFSLSLQSLFPFYLLMMLVLYTVYRRIGSTVDEIRKQSVATDEKLTRGFWIYSSSVLLNTIGLMPIALILYNGARILESGGQLWLVPFLYVIVQLIDAPMALVSGYFYDKFGLKFLTVPFILSVLPLAFQSLIGLPGVVLACISYGLVLGMQESIYRAAVTDIVPLGRRGSAYGFFNVMLGVGTFLSGVIFGYMIDASISQPLILGFVIFSQALAIALLWMAKQEKYIQT
ncbi:MFS transporter [Candidatus Bathyarchaeota archaeon]|nr:MFS transporter [Candidatus Bathyarchaeota archaeon]MBS7631737.1 MFS transporter [Candidatus Bathyarchaeota archaeon]